MHEDFWVTNVKIILCSLSGVILISTTSDIFSKATGLAEAKFYMAPLDLYIERMKVGKYIQIVEEQLILV